MTTSPAQPSDGTTAPRLTALTRPPRDLLAVPTPEAARRLLGWLVVTELPEGRTVGRIVETEAYLGPDDPASHAASRRNGRVTAMWGDVGIAYVYRSYGLHAMLNVVAKPPGAVGAVLIRALEPVAGLEVMQRRRGQDDPRALCSGPGKLCRAMGVSLADHGRDLLTDGRLWLATGSPPATVHHGCRIGISRATDWPLRYWDADSPFVSAHRRGGPYHSERDGAVALTTLPPAFPRSTPRPA